MEASGKRRQRSTGRLQYVSDFDQFMEQFLRMHPEVEEDRQRGWYIWWDHLIDPDQAEAQRLGTVPFKSYD